MNRLIIIGIALVVVAYIAFSSVYVVNQREQAVVMRFGEITDVKTEPGLYWKIPTNVVDAVQIIESRLLRYDLANMTVQVSGGKFYRVDAFLTYRIANPRLFRERALGDLGIAEQRIATRFDAALRQVYGLREFDAALSEARPQMMREARDLIRPDMAELGIDIVDVRIQRTDLTDQVTAQTYERMKAERLAEAALLRARGQEAAQSLRAVADRQAVEILAAARRDAEIMRGEGDALRADIFAQAYMRDPGFFDFYRSLQAYRLALGPTGTTMVLSPDTEFFRYFAQGVAIGDGALQATAPPGFIEEPDEEAMADAPEPEAEFEPAVPLVAEPVPEVGAGAGQ